VQKLNFHNFYDFKSFVSPLFKMDIIRHVLSLFMYPYALDIILFFHR